MVLASLLKSSKFNSCIWCKTVKSMVTDDRECQIRIIVNSTSIGACKEIGLVIVGPYMEKKEKEKATNSIDNLSPFVQ